MRKRIPKGRVLRKVMLDRKALMWALNSMKDDKYNVETRRTMSLEWATKYAEAEKHLLELIAAAERA